MRLGISEILDQCNKLNTVEEQVIFLRRNDSNPLRMILQFALDPRVTWMLPEGNPPYKPCEFVDQQNRLFQEIRKLQYFVRGIGGPDDQMHRLKRETMFIEFIEGLDPEDAKLICAAKDKTIPYDRVTVEVINQAFPNLIFVKEV